ncbi:DNA alkylation repair protein [Pseudarthrobacter sp. AG30]|uniref:DNA alkylation repair protein n=1 Tax=Pseudarthrobacter sp. AG30 TaxID=2249742 RepID=UPI000D64602B|nr:DNA alkylation repair protein [Pseudarthrobacter sp. AG30]RAX17886.1 DNA alkylation repair protein [Pseudarthrobacter sp. AG30]
MTEVPDVAAAAEFIDRTLQNEGAWYRADEVGYRLGGALASYGSSIGAVRGTVRDALRKFKDMGHDTTVMLASALWGQPKPGSQPVFERRLAAVVLLQTKVQVLRHSDLTRLEGFLRSAQAAELAGPLVSDVLVPLLAGLDHRDRQRAAAVLARWREDPESQLQTAARLVEKELTQ